MDFGQCNISGAALPSARLCALARVRLYLHWQQKASAMIIRRNSKAKKTPKLVRALTADFKVFFFFFRGGGSAEPEPNKPAIGQTHACDQHYSCSENKQTQQQGKELKEGAGGKADNLFFWHVQRGWRWISCIYSVKRGKKGGKRAKQVSSHQRKQRFSINSP